MTTSADIRFDRFPRFEELTDRLHALAAESNGMLELSTIGRSYEGRELWLATVTNPATGSHVAADGEHPTRRSGSRRGHPDRLTFGTER